MTMLAGGLAYAEDIQDVADIVAAVPNLPKGFITDRHDTASGVGTTTTEVVSTFVQFAGVAGRRYGILYRGAHESTVASDIDVMKLRQASSTSDVSGSQIATTKDVAASSANIGKAFSLWGEYVATSTGTQTVVATIKRDTGTGTVKQNGATADMELYFAVQDIGV